MHLILANLPWRHLQERAEKIQGDKKHAESMLSQSHYVAQFNTAHKLLNSARWCRALVRVPVTGQKRGSRRSTVVV